MVNNDCAHCSEKECLCWDCVNKEECGNFCLACDREQFPVTECEQYIDVKES